MKRIVQYLILAAVLVGLPLGCAWIGGYHEVLADVFEIAPRCEDWVNDPARLWRVKCPFNWWIFAAMGGVVFAAVAALLGTFKVFDEAAYTGMAKVDIRSGVSVVTLVGLTLIGLSGIVFFPQFAYPLLWISPLMGFVLVQVMFREKCVLDVLVRGNWGIVFRFAIAALICGLVWETWNYYSMAKWIYNVPWAERFKVWEMPVMGFAGYLPFGMECAVIAAWIDERLIRR